MILGLIFSLLLTQQVFTLECEENKIYYYQQCISKSCLDDKVSHLKTLDEMKLTQAINEDEKNYIITLTFSDPDLIIGPTSCLEYGIYQNEFPVPSANDAMFYAKAANSLTFTNTLTQQDQLDKITISFSKLDVQDKCFNQTDATQFKWTCSFYFTLELSSQPLLIYFFDTIFTADISTQGTAGDNPNTEGPALMSMGFTFGASTQFSPYQSSLGSQTITKSVNSALYFCADESCATTDVNINNLGLTLSLNKLFYMVHEITENMFKNLYITETKVKFQSPDLSIQLAKGDQAMPKIYQEPGKTRVQLRVPVYGNNIQILFTGVLSLHNTRIMTENDQILNNRRYLQNDTFQTQNLVSKLLTVNQIAPYELSQKNTTNNTVTNNVNSSTNLGSTNNNLDQVVQPVQSDILKNISTNQVISNVQTDLSQSSGILLYISKIFLFTFCGLLILI